MNAPRDPHDIPGCIAKREPDAEFAWSSNRRLVVSKGNTTISLSADDLKRQLNFIEACAIEVQL